MQVSTIEDRLGFARIPVRGRLFTHYTGLISHALRQLIAGQSIPDAAEGIVADQPQQNAAYGVHQFRVLLPDDANIYRVIIAPADAPIAINGIPADEHFSEPLNRANARSAA